MYKQYVSHHINISSSVKVCLDWSKYKAYFVINKTNYLYISPAIKLLSSHINELSINIKHYHNQVDLIFLLSGLYTFVIFLYIIITKLFNNLDKKLRSGSRVHNINMV